MDALILSCGTGGGHNSAAQAIQEELTARGHYAVLLNPYTLKSDQLAKTIDNIYIELVQKAPHVFGVVYNLGQLVRRLPFPSPVYYANELMAPIMRRYLEAHKFDIIIMTHIFPGQILTGLKKHGFEIPPTIFIATDYTCIPFTEEIDCDAYVIPSEQLRKEFEKRGIPSKKIYPFGIPVKEVFETPMSRKRAAKLLGLDYKKRYILVSGGSIGAGNIKKVLKTLYRLYKKDPSFHIIAICGSRSGLASKLQKKYGEKVTIVGHTDQMAAYLSISDLYLTKPGGLSSTEAAVFGVPLVHITPIPGCESKNQRFFSKNGMSFSVRKPKRKLRRAVRKTKDQSVRDKMILHQRATIPNTATASICNFAEQMAADTADSRKLLKNA